MQKNVEEYITNKIESIPEGLLENSAHMAQCQVNAIRSIDYVTFHKKNPLAIAHSNFCTTKLVEISTTLECGNYLKRAILTSRISNLKQFGQEVPVTSADTLVRQTLVITNEKFLSLLGDLSDYLEVVDQACSNRFGWNEIKMKIDESHTSVINATKLENFLAQKGYQVSPSEKKSL